MFPFELLDSRLFRAAAVAGDIAVLANCHNLGQFDCSGCKGIRGKESSAHDSAHFLNGPYLETTSCEYSQVTLRFFGTYHEPHELTAILL